MSACVYACVVMYMHVCLCICMEGYVYVCVRMYMYVCLWYVCKGVYMCIPDETNLAIRNRMSVLCKDNGIICKVNIKTVAD